MRGLTLLFRAIEQSLLVMVTLWALQAGVFVAAGLLDAEMLFLERLHDLYWPAIRLFSVLVPQSWQFRGNVLLGLMGCWFAMGCYAAVGAVVWCALRHVLGRGRTSRNRSGDDGGLHE